MSYAGNRGRGRGGRPVISGPMSYAQGPPMGIPMTTQPRMTAPFRGGPPSMRGRTFSRGGYRAGSAYPSGSRAGTTRHGGACPGCNCSFNSKYSMSLGGLCKTLQIVCLLVTWAIIASTPYWRRYMIIEGVTWPFHLVMLITIVVWLSTLCLYFIFLMGWHFSYKSIMWPGVDLWFNVS